MFVPKIRLHKINPNRVLLLDSDILGYDCSYGVTIDQLDNMYTHIDLKIRACMEITGCGAVELHLSGVDNFRTHLAVTKAYKGNRYHPDGSRKTPQPEFLPQARAYMLAKPEGRLSVREEADDTISKRNWEILTGCCIMYDECVIATTDKDIGINPGVFLNLMDDKISYHQGFGELWLTKSGTLKGWGLKFFLAQMLMGDATDNIPGLPRVPVLAKELYGIYRGGFGPKKAYACLVECTNYSEGLDIVADLYEAYFEEFSNSHTESWDGHRMTISWHNLMLEQGRLLWMRRRGTELWDIKMTYDKLEEELWKHYEMPMV